MKHLLLASFCAAGMALCAQSVKTPFGVFADTTGSQNFFYKAVTKTDGAGNIYVAGATVNAAGNRDLLVAKYSSAGVQQWVVQYDGAAHAEDFATALVLDGSGNVFLTGAVSSNTATGLPDAVTIKYNSSGVQQWMSTYNGSGNSYDAGADIALDAGGNVYITGGAYNTTPNSDILILKYDASGSQQGVRQADGAGHLDDAGVRLSVSGGTVSVASGTENLPGSYKFGINLVAASTGSTLSTALSSSVTTAVDQITDMAQDASGNIYLSGSIPVTGHGYDFYLIKFNSSLVIQWQQTYNGSANLDDRATSIDLDASGNVFVSGYSTSGTQGKDFITQKYNSGGTLQWTQAVDHNSGDDEANDLVVDASGNVIAAGFTASDINGLDYYCVKYDNSGTKIWDIQSDFIHRDDMGTTLALDTVGDVVLTGQTQTAPGAYKYYTVKYTEKDVITPTDFNGEVPQSNFLYYANKGQVVDTALAAVSSVKYYTNFTSPSFYVKESSLSFVFSKIDTVASTTDTLHRVDLAYNFVNGTAKTYPLDQQKSYLNYFLGYTSGPITGVFGNERLITKDLYRNIDLVYSSNQNGIKMYYIIKPGGNPADIKMEFTGASSYSLNGTSNALSIHSSIGSLTFDRPTVYQLTTGNATVAVTGWTADWQTNGAANKYKFNTGAYTSSLTLVIEVDEGNAAYSPASLQNINWSTYLGSNSADAIREIKSDANNNLFVVGLSSANLFPNVPSINIYQSTLSGGLDGIIAKFDPTGAPVWATYVGGSRDDQFTSFDFSPSGDVYAVGNTTSDNLIVKDKGAFYNSTFVGPNDPTYGWLQDGFIFQLAQDGKTNPWLTYYTANYNDNFYRCKFDASGNFFVIGSTGSSDAPVVASTPQYSHSYSGGGSLVTDGYIVRFDAGSNRTWATCIGSTSDDELYGLDFDASGDLYVVGHSTSSGYYTTGSPTSSFGGGGDDAVISRFSNTGTPKWSAYVGGSGTDIAQSVKIKNGNVYMVGSCGSGFPVNNSSQYYYNASNAGTTDAFFSVFNSSNTRTHSTFIGGSSSDEAWDIQIDANDFIYIGGKSSSSNFPVPASGNPSNTYDQGLSGGTDYFVCAVRNGMTGLAWSTLIGGTGNESSGFGENVRISTDGNNNLHLAGRTFSSANFPLDNGGGPPVWYQPALNGSSDGSITRFNLLNVQLVGIKENASVLNGLSVYPNPTQQGLTVKIDNFTQGMDYNIYNSIGQVILSGKLVQSSNEINVSGLSAGMYILEVHNNATKKSVKFMKHD